MTPLYNPPTIISIPATSQHASFPVQNPAFYFEEKKLKKIRLKRQRPAALLHLYPILSPGDFLNLSPAHTGVW